MKSSTELSHCAQYVVPVGFMGAPAVMNEKPNGGVEVRRAFEALCAFMNGKIDGIETKIDEETGVEFIRLENSFRPEAWTDLKPFLAVMPLEIGGLNSTEPLALSGDLGSFCLDADLMGRAFPELQVNISIIIKFKNGIVNQKITRVYKEKK